MEWKHWDCSGELGHRLQRRGAREVDLAIPRQGDSVTGGDSFTILVSFIKCQAAQIGLGDNIRSRYRAKKNKESDHAHPWLRSERTITRAHLTFLAIGSSVRLSETLKKNREGHL